MENKLLSIIVPVYNVESYIAECLDSVLQQKYKEIELIIIDDGSTDRSGEICDQYALTDSRIQVIHSKNSGVSSARNKGLKHAKGAYITFVDPDDLVLSDIYVQMIHILENDEVDACCCSYYNLVDGKKITVSPANKLCKGISAMRTMLSEDYYTTVVWNKVFRREAILNGDDFEQFDVGYTVGEDEKWLFDVLKDQNVTMQFIGNPLYCWRKRENSAINQNSRGITRQKLDSVRIHEHLLIEAKKMRDNQLENLFEMKLYQANESLAQNCYVRKDNENFLRYYSQIRKKRKPKDKSMKRWIKNRIWVALMECRYLRIHWG